MRKILLLVALAALAGCGADDGATPAASRTAAPAPPPEVKATAETSDIAWDGSEPGVTPFIAFVRLTGLNLADVTTVTYTIQPRTGSVSRPVEVTYARAALERQQRFESGQMLRLPVFGLYAGYGNEVSIRLSFRDCSTQTLAGTLTSADYTDPAGVYDHPTFIKARAADSVLGFDFFAMKSGSGTPIVVDTDGAIRWVGTSRENSISSVWTDNGFVIGDQRSTKVRRLELDGTETTYFPATTLYTKFHHNITAGKTGLLVAMDTATDREVRINEFTLSGGFGREWNFADIVAAQMASGGDDPALFVRPPSDWFHANDAIYDARDDSMIVSSRENFVMKIDYETGAIKWLLGDPTKYWYGFPSLRAKALTLESGGLYPIGQHGLSITSDGLLLLFNAGNPSESQPTGAPAGETRAYSAVSAYRIDETTLTAQEVWDFDYGQSLYSDHCGSVYEGPDQSLLISYARAEDRLKARLVGLNRAHDVVFDIQYDSQGCNTSWNAFPIPFENLRFD